MSRAPIPNSVHRHNSRGKPSAQVMPHFFRRKLTKSQITDLGLAHDANLAALLAGNATPEVMWQWAGGVLTWSRVAMLKHIGAVELEEQAKLAAKVVERYAETGAVSLLPEELELVKRGTIYQDQLAEITDEATALHAAAWSERLIGGWASRVAFERGDA
jgi:hypothetical protein